MRYVIAFLLLATPALASGEAWKSLEVPDPIPEDFNKCVQVIWTDKGKAAGVDGRVGQMDPPLTREDHAYLEYWRREGWGVLKLCGDTEDS